MLEFDESTSRGRRCLWTPSHAHQLAVQSSRTALSVRTRPAEKTYDLLRQPETSPISQEQLVAEVKGIYAGLVMVEARCIEVDNNHQADDAKLDRLNNEQWQALIALHQTLLHEHHDFFLASQHPSASPAIRRLATKYGMPAKMWRHGIHSFLELLRHRSPASLDHMLAFIHLAYSMMALLYETVPAFEDTWIECLGDLARYRMAIEDDDIRDREVWTGVARHWYSKASDKAPTTGRLYHHLAILARPNALQQLFYYSKSLCVEIPFTSARESILTLFEPVMNAIGPAQYRLPPLDTAFVKAHGLLFTGKDMDKFEPTVKDFHALLDNQIGRVTRRFTEQGFHIVVANAVAMLGFRAKENILMKAINQNQSFPEITPLSLTKDFSLSMTSFKHAESLSNRTFEIVLQRIGDPNVLPFIHVTLVFVLYVSAHSNAMSLIQDDLPWDLPSAMLNTLLGSYRTPARTESNEFPLPEKENVCPEDYVMRGHPWTVPYFPNRWFNNDEIDEEEKYREAASITEQRKERTLWQACMISKRDPWMYEKFWVPIVSTQSMTVPTIELEKDKTFATPEPPSCIEHRKLLPPEVKKDVHPFPEDHTLRGLLWADTYFPENWFSNEKIDEEETYLDLASTSVEQTERLFWVAHGLAMWGRSWMVYNYEKTAFGDVEKIETKSPKVHSRENSSNIELGFLSRFGNTKIVGRFCRTMSSWRIPHFDFQ